MTSNKTYKHLYFTLNPIAKKVFDENGKELFITGNAYRVLEFLCENKHAKLLEIGEFLDSAKEYSEDHLRQYRYKINTLIGHKVVEYRNNIYSIEGEIKELDRNTDLLHQKSPEFSGMDKEKDTGQRRISVYLFPAIFAGVVLFLSLLSLPSGYYTFLRIVVTISALYYAYCIYAEKMEYDGWFWLLIFVAILFNPVAPIYLLKKSLWLPIDILSAIFLLINARRIKKEIGNKQTQ